MTTPLLLVEHGSVDLDDASDICHVIEIAKGAPLPVVIPDTTTLVIEVGSLLSPLPAGWKSIEVRKGAPFPVFVR